jgi:hypothetical protein
MSSAPATRTHLATVPGTLPGVNFNVMLFTSDGEELVEFYDTRYPHGPYGQFVSRYYKSSIEGCVGLDLDGGIPEWKVSAEGMRAALKALSSK